MPTPKKFIPGKSEVFNLFNLAGINRKLNPYVAKPNELAMCLNVNSDEIGAKKKRQGWATFLDAIDSDEVYGLIPFYKSDGTRILLRNSGTSIYKTTTGSGSWGSAVKTGLTDNKQLVGTVLENVLFLCNGYDRSMTYDGTTFANEDTQKAVGGSAAVRSSNTVTITTSTDHGFTAGDIVWIEGIDDTSFNGRFTIASTPTTDTFTYAQTGSDTTSGNGTASVADAPLGTSAVTWQSRIYANDTRNKQRVYFSAISDATDWTVDFNDTSAAGYFDCEHPVTGLAVMQNRVIIFTENGIYRWDGYARTEVAAQYGTTLSKSIIASDNELYYSNPLGIFSYTGGRPGVISQKVEELIYKATFSDPSPGCLWRNKYYVFVPSIALPEKTYTNCLIVFDVLLREWFLYTFPKTITSMCTWASSATTSDELIFGTSDGNTYKFSKEATELSDATEPIDVEITTLPLSFATPFGVKNIKRIYGYGKPSNDSSLHISGDNQGYKQVGTMLGEISKHTISEQLGTGRKSIVLRITDNSVQPFLLRGTTIFYDVVGER